MKEMTRAEGERAYLLKQAVKAALAENAEGSKVIIREAITEWLNSKFAQFGRWSVIGIAAAALALLAYLLLIKTGWTPPR